MIAYPTAQTRTCDLCCVSQTLDPESSICITCAERLAAKVILAKRKRPSIWQVIKTAVAVSWYYRVPRGHCVQCGLRKADCECDS